MAKKASKDVNKSAEVRAILEKNPKTPVKDIVEDLTKRGMKISSNLVYLIKSKMKGKKRREKREKAVETSRNSGVANPVALIMEVRTLAGKAGGIRHLKQLVDLLAE